MGACRGDRTTVWILSILAVIATFTACLCFAISLATDHWQDTTVDRLGLMKIVKYKPELDAFMQTNQLYFDRTRGLFYWCSDALNVRGVAGEVCMFDLAFDEDFVLDFSHANVTDGIQDVNEKIYMRNKLVISIVGLLIGAAGCALITGLVGIAAVFKTKTVLFTAGMVLSFLASVFAGTAMAIFHGVDYLEKIKLSTFIFPAVLRENPAYNELETHTTISYSYSYALGWVGVGLSCTTTLLYLQTRIKHKKKKEKQREEAVTTSSTSLFREPRFVKYDPKKPRKSIASTLGSPESVRNNAYDMIEKPVSVTGSDPDSSPTPTTDDWNPYNELSPDDPINFM